MIASIRNCFGLEPKQAKANTPKECIFCGITKEKGFNVMYEDEAFIVFRDRSPGAKMHLLCVPKQHIDNVKSLKAADVPMLHTMKGIGTRLLDEAGFADVQHRLGFHIPPFFSVNHLHLHILGLPCVTIGDRLKYRPSMSSRHSKGFSHFVQVDQAIRILDKGGQVGVWPC